MKRLGKKFQFLSFELFFFLLRNKIQTENNTKEDFFLLVNINLQSKRSVRWIVSLPRQFTSSLFKTLQLTFELKSRRTESNVCALNCKWNIFCFSFSRRYLLFLEAFRSNCGLSEQLWAAILIPKLDGQPTHQVLIFFWRIVKQITTSSFDLTLLLRDGSSWLQLLHFRLLYIWQNIFGTGFELGSL